VQSTEIDTTGNWWEYWPADPQAPGVETNMNALWPRNPVENFELSYSTITNCGCYDSAAVRPYNLKNSSIHDSTIDASSSLTKPINGTCAFLDNVDIYNNNFTVGYYTDTSSWAIELWMFRRGCEIYNNVSNGSFSITMGKETKVHDNTIVATVSNSYKKGAGIEFIGQTEGAVYNNYIENVGGYGIDVGFETHGSGEYIVRNIEVYNNMIYNPRYESIVICNLGDDRKTYHHIVENVNVYNNICDDMDSSRTYLGQINIRSQSGVTGKVTTKNISIKQNILVNSSGYAGRTNGVIANLVIDGNLFWHNYNNSWSGSTPTNTIVEDPKYLATGDRPLPYYELQEDSPMWDAFNSGVAIEPPPNVRVVKN
jgi:hypothetical protein